MRWISLLLLVSAGGGDDAYDEIEPANQVVFGIAQSTTADGQPETSAGYSIIRYRDRGFDFRTVASPLGRCRFEDLTARPESIQGLNAGVATFRGAGLPADGLRILPENSKQRASFIGHVWTGGETLGFETSGFSLPAVAATVRAPASRLTIVAPPPSGEGPLVVDRTKDLALGWEAAKDTVMVSAITGDDAQAKQLLCTFDAGSTSGVLPAAGLAQLTHADGERIKGRLQILTHQQAAGVRQGWAIYVVATATQMDRAFTTAP